MSSSLKLALSAASLVIGLAVPAALRADTLNVTLTSASQTVTSGSSVTFTGTIAAPSANADTLYINSADDNLYGSMDIVVDTTDALYTLNFPDTLLTPGSSAIGDLFTVAVPTGEMAGTYSGILTIYGGNQADYSGTDTLADVPFSITVPDAASVTPEPSSYLLFATGLFGAALLARRHQLRSF